MAFSISVNTCHGYALIGIERRTTTAQHCYRRMYVFLFFILRFIHSCMNVEYVATDMISCLVCIVLYVLANIMHMTLY